MQVASVTLRDVTERPETIEAGGNILSGVGLDDVARCVATVTGMGKDWAAPKEYLDGSVSERIARILVGFRSG
jgi:UDP-N-acetylglucosamine 2-epimerase (non-hydrolysing)